MRGSNGNTMSTGTQKVIPLTRLTERILSKLPPEPRKPPKKTRIPGMGGTAKRSRFTDHDVVMALVLRALGISRETIATHLACSPMTIAQWERGTNRTHLNPL